MNDDFFAPLGNNKPYFKAAFEGFAGSGKTHTAALVAIGLHKRIKSEKPVIIFDTEKASKFLKPLFEKEGIEVLVRESKSLADLQETMKRMRAGASDILVIDSISHIWENFLNRYAEKVKRTRLQFQDWGIIKPTWKAEFSDPFVNDEYHVIMTGRAGYEYDTEINEDTGKREMYKSGIKMKVEGETAYEPDLLVLMERMQEMDGGDIKRVYRRAVTIKDRSTLLDGKVLENPNYKSFAPCIEALLTSPEKHETSTEVSAASLFKTEEERYEFRRERDIAIEEIEGFLTQIWPSTSAAEKKNKVDAIEYAFGTRSWTKVAQLFPADLKIGLEKIKEFAKERVGGEAQKQAPEDASVKEKPEDGSTAKHEAMAPKI